MTEATNNEIITSDKIAAARRVLENSAKDRFVLVDSYRGVHAAIYPTSDIVSYSYYYERGSQRVGISIPLGTSDDTTLEQVYEIAKVYHEMRKYRIDPVDEAKKLFSQRIKEGWRPEIKQHVWDKRTVN